MDEYGSETSCALCADAEPNVRYGHYLDMAKGEDFDAIQRHLWEFFRSRKSFDAQDAKERIEGLMYWIREQVSAYTRKADPITGAKMPWWEARRQTILAMRQITVNMAKEADAAKAEREAARWGKPVNTAPTWTPTHVEAHDYIREPGDEEPEIAAAD